jgi:hypothetical protein
MCVIGGDSGGGVTFLNPNFDNNLIGRTEATHLVNVNPNTTSYD